MIFVLWRLGCLSTRLADCFSRSNVFSGACTAPESGKLYFDSEKCLPVAMHAAVGPKMNVIPPAATAGTVSLPGQSQS